jgi:hypothetical protein
MLAQAEVDVRSNREQTKAFQFFTAIGKKGFFWFKLVFRKYRK